MSSSSSSADSSATPATNTVIFATDDEVPEIARIGKEINDAAWRNYYRLKSEDFDRYMYTEAMFFEAEKAHQTILRKHLSAEQKDTTDNFNIFFPSGADESNVWTSLRQVGPVPSVTAPKLEPSTCTNYSEMVIPRLQLYTPHEGTKIWDWMGPSRVQQHKEYLKACQLRGIAMETIVEKTPEPSVSVAVSPIQSSSDASSDSESSDSGCSSSGSTVSVVFKSFQVKKATRKPAKVKIFTEDEVKKREQIVDEWKKLIQKSLA